jgi:hypothetical protein
MRTIVDIPENEIKALDLLGQKKKMSRTALVREAVQKLLHEEQQAQKGKLDQYFGMFQDDPTVFNGLDGLSYQHEMRSEWAERDAAVDKRLADNRGLSDQKQAPYRGKE